MFTIAHILIFALPPLFSAALLAALHWFPWHNGARELSRVDAYTLGTAVLIVVPSATMLCAAATGNDYGAAAWSLLLVVNALAGGGTVRAAYWIDSQRAIGRGDA